MASWLTSTAWPVVKGLWRVFIGVMKQAAIPVVASLGWAVYTTARKDTWDWTIFVSTWGSTLAVLSILTSQWFRVAKQIRDRDDFGTIHLRMDSLQSLMEGLQQNRQGADQPPIIVGELDPHPAPAAPLLRQEHRLHTEMEPNDFFRQAWALFDAGQDYPAMWMAAMGYERVLREQAVRMDIMDASLRRIIDGLPTKYVDGRLRRDLGLLNRIRNNLAHPLPYPGGRPDPYDHVDPSSVIRSFEVASQELENIMRNAFSGATLPR